MSNTQLWKHARALMKTHEIMDGSGSLYLLDINQKVTKAQVKEVQAYVYAGLKERGIEFEEKKISGTIAQTLFFCSVESPNSWGLCSRSRGSRGSRNRRRSRRQSRSLH